MNLTTGNKLPTAMNETNLADEISIRHLVFDVRHLQSDVTAHWERIQHQARQIHDHKRMIDQLFAGYAELNSRMAVLETPAPQDTLSRRLKALDEKANAGGLTCDESEERTWLVKRINSMPPTVGNAYTSPAGWEAKQKAAEAKCGTALEDEIRDAHRCLNTYQIPEAPCLIDRIEHLRFAKLPKWRDAKSDPPKADGDYLTYLTERRPSSRYMIGTFDRVTGAWDTEDGALVTSYVTHWQELPPPPQATESK